MMEEISLYDASVATHIGGHLSLGSKGIVLYGTEEQKKRFLPKIATGEWICAYALTEPVVGIGRAGAQEPRRLRSRAQRVGPQRQQDLVHERRLRARDPDLRAHADARRAARRSPPSS
jgi:hypothetical protein